jgi:hypothetical protein
VPRKTANWPRLGIFFYYRLIKVNVGAGKVGQELAGVEIMQVLCKRTNGNAEVQCCVCGQGFVIFWERQSRSERLAAMREIQQALRTQHHNQKGLDAHPESGFLVPKWDQRVSFSGASVPGHAPTWAL